MIDSQGQAARPQQQQQQQPSSRRGVGSAAPGQRSRASEPAEHAVPRGGRAAGPSGQEQGHDSLPAGSTVEAGEPPLPGSRSFDSRVEQRPFRGMDGRRAGPALRGGTFSPPMQPSQQQRQQQQQHQLNAQLYYQSMMYQHAASYGFLPGYMASPGDALLAAVAQQIEYYFSVQNLCKDLFLRGRMDDAGWIPIEVIAGFNRVRTLTTDLAVIVQSLRGSHVVEVGAPLSCPDVRASVSCRSRGLYTAYPPRTHFCTTVWLEGDSYLWCHLSSPHQRWTA